MICFGSGQRVPAAIVNIYNRGHDVTSFVRWRTRKDIYSLN